MSGSESSEEGVDGARALGPDHPEEFLDLSVVPGYKLKSGVCGTLNLKNEAFTEEIKPIGIPSKEKLKDAVKFMLKLFERIKDKGSSVMDKLRVKGLLIPGVTNQVTLSKDGDYVDGEDFIATGEVLGKGDSSTIAVVQDRSGSEHALRTVMISLFEGNEIRAWVDLNETGIVPMLYLFRYDKGTDSVVMHMEIINGITLKEVIENHRQKLKEHGLLKHYSMFILNEMLHGVHCINEHNWIHYDIHDENLMLSDEVKVKFLDFELCETLNPPGPKTLDNFKSDIRDIVTIFLGSAVGEVFTSHWEVEMKHKERILAAQEREKLSDDDISDVLKVTGAVLAIQCPKDVGSVRKELVCEEISKEMLEKMRNIIFRMKWQDSEEESMDFDTYKGETVFAGGDAANFSSNCKQPSYMDFHSLRKRRSLSVDELQIYKDSFYIGKQQNCSSI